MKANIFKSFLYLLMLILTNCKSKNEIGVMIYLEHKSSSDTNTEYIKKVEKSISISDYNNKYQHIKFKKWVNNAEFDKMTQLDECDGACLKNSDCKGTGCLCGDAGTSTAFHCY